MRLRLIITISYLVLHAAWGHGTHGGRHTHYTQPNGDKIKLVVHGGQHYARTETPDGYTVVYNPEDKSYYYALLNTDGTAYISSGLLVGQDSPDKLTKHLKISTSERRKKVQSNRERYDQERDQRWQQQINKAKYTRQKKIDLIQMEPLYSQGELSTASDELYSAIQASTVTGAKVGLTILVAFPDDPNTAGFDPTTFPTTQAKIDRYCNEIGYTDDGNTGSIRDYFLDQSNNNLDYTSLVTSIVTMPNARNYYNFSDYPNNTTLRDSGDAGNLLVNDAITQLNLMGFNFDGLTIDGNRVLATNVLFAGDDSGVWSEGLWPHQWAVYNYNPVVSVDGTSRSIFAYQITNINNSSPTIGTYIHESGHLVLDLPDLYDYDGDSRGIGTHGIMASGNFSNSGRTPSPLNIYFKDILGWANITELTAQQSLATALTSTGNVGVRISNPSDSNEFFMFENRGDGDPWAASVPDKGILIWHVDESVSGNDNQQMTSASHYQVSLEQQDGDFDLENDNNSGDSTDAFDINSSEFNDTNTPNANWWDGSDSGILFNVFSAASSSMQVTFGVADTIFVTSPASGSSFIAGTTNTITWTGNFTGEAKIDLYQSEVFVETISSSTANDGSYEWTISNDMAVGSDYSIVISSVLDSAITDTSDTFTIMQELFAANGIFPVIWNKSSDSTAGWEIASDASSEGLYSIKNNDINDDETASIEMTGSFDAGTITFDAKVSTEQSYDFLYFFIDGVAQDLNTSGSGTGLSGVVDWTSFSFPITAGEHELKFVYDKDYSVSNNDDTVWIDNISLPLQESASDLFLAWNSTYNIDSSDLTIDSDGDGLSNLLEYAIGTDPSTSSSDPSTSSILDLDGDEFLTLTVIQRKDASDLGISYSVVKSSNLSSWDSDNIIATTPVSVSDTMESVTYTLNTPLDQLSVNYYMRYEITLAE